MPTYDVQFVDSIAASPTVRLDLDGPGWTVRDSTKFGTPELRRAAVATLLGDGDQYPASAYANRTITLVVRVDAATDDLIAGMVQQLMRELDRPRNILRYRPGTSSPVFFRTFRAGPENVDWNPHTKEITAIIPAEPFAYGLREDLPQVTVLSDPAGVAYSGNISDAFTRTVSNGWGNADTGQAWQHFGTLSAFSVDGSVGQHTHTAVNSGRISVVEAGSTDARVRVTGSVPVTAVGAGTALTIYACARFTDDNNFYQARLGFIPDLNVTCSVRKRVAGVDTTIDSIVTGLTHVAGQRYTVELEVVGSQLRARVWREGDPVPGWHASAIDTDLTTGTKVGVRTIIDAGSGNTMPLTYSIDNFQVPPLSPCYFDVSGVKGDVETPLYITVPSSNSNFVTSAPESSRVSAIAVRRRGNPSAAPFLLQAEAMSMASVDTTVQANSTVMSGSGSNWTRTTFSSGMSMAARLSINPWPAVASSDVRGAYRVFMRYRPSTISPGQMQARLRWGTGNAAVTNDTVDLIRAYGGAPASPYLLYADLGIVQFPQGYDPVTDGPDGVDLPVEGMYIAVEAARLAGSASLDIDCLLFVPADDRLLLVTWPASPTLPATLTLDSDRGQVYVEGSAGLVGRSGAQLAGGPPMVSPGVTNRVTFVRDVGVTSSTGGGAGGDDITASTLLAPYYWPKYLYARPRSS